MKRIPVPLQLVVLAVALTSVYTMVGQAVPQKEVRPPEVIEIQQDISSVEMAAIGKTIFEGKGICNTCHTIGRSGALRFPDLDGVAGRAASREPGVSALDYLARSLYEPNSFILPGFNPGMPEIDKPPIGLTDDEILTVIAYLQTLGGEPTVTMATRFVYTGGSATTSETNAVATPTAAATTDDPLSRRGCTACHYDDRAGELAGPSLWDAGKRLGRAKLVDGITFHEPTPADKPYPSDLSLPEIQGMVEYITGLEGLLVKLLVLLPILLAIVALRLLKARTLAWMGALWLGIFVALRYGFHTPVPVSVVKLYMGIVSLSLLAYVLSDAGRRRDVWLPLRSFLSERRYQPALAVVALAIPALVAWQTHARLSATPGAPSFARTVHPAPPDSITVHGTDYPLGTLDNPYRELETTNPEAFQERVSDGRRVYYENCFYCHGDLMAGEGIFAHGLNPIPTDFQDAGTIPMLREAFLFWRIAKGGPGLPDEGGPWQSAMPVWESFLSDDEMWNVILFLYDFTGRRPRAVEVAH